MKSKDEKPSLEITLDESFTALGSGDITGTLFARVDLLKSAVRRLAEKAKREHDLGSETCLSYSRMSDGYQYGCTCGSPKHNAEVAAILEEVGL